MTSFKARLRRFRIPETPSRINFLIERSQTSLLPRNPLELLSLSGSVYFSARRRRNSGAKITFHFTSSDSCGLSARHTQRAEVTTWWWNFRAPGKERNHWSFVCAIRCGCVYKNKTLRFPSFAFFICLRFDSSVTRWTGIWISGRRKQISAIFMLVFTYGPTIIGRWWWLALVLQKKFLLFTSLHSRRTVRALSSPSSGNNKTLFTLCVRSECLVWEPESMR